MKKNLQAIAIFLSGCVVGNMLDGNYGAVDHNARARYLSANAKDQQNGQHRDAISHASPPFNHVAHRNLNASTQVYFSPNMQCEQKIIAAIKQARIQILVQCYSFTSIGITNALIGAHNRGIAVKVLYDRSQIKQRSSRIQSLMTAGILGPAHETENIAR